MPQKPSSAGPFVPKRTKEAWTLALIVTVAGGLVGGCYGGLIGAAQQSGALSLKPYLDPSWINVVVSWIAPAFRSPLFAAVVLALGSGALVLFCDAVIRRVFLAEKPGAAALAAVLVLLAAAWGVVLKLEGHWGILAGFFLAPLAGLLILEAPGALAWIGCGIGFLCGTFHPAWMGVWVAIPALARARSRPLSRSRHPFTLGWAALLILGMTVVLHETSTGMPLPFVDRLRFAARDLAAAPILVFSPWRRLDVPTGYEPLVSSAPVIAGIAIHALILGVGMMIGGVKRGVVCAGAAIAGVFAAALLVPGYVPGDRAFVLPAIVAYVPLVALVFGAVPQRLARAVMPGLILGVAAIAVLLADDRAPSWTRIGPALDIPGARDFTREQDLARLVLYLNDVTLRDADAAAVVAAADKLVESEAPALFPERLKSIFAQLTLRAGKPPRTPELARLISEVSDELAFLDRLWSQGARANFEPVAEGLVRLHTKVLDLHFKWSGEPDSIRVVRNFVRAAQTIIPVASRCGYYDYSLPLIEALQLIGPDSPNTAATIALQHMLSGEIERSRGELEEALKTLPPKSQFTALVRGALGMTILAAGDQKAALRELQAAWSVIGQGGVKNVALTVAVDLSDYYLVGEILLARFEAAKAVDPALAPQAARDLEELLKPPLSFGPRRVPALGIMGKLELLLGHRDRALALLREARQIPAATLDDRSDGPIGRIAHPRYRRFVLETLKLALGDGADTAQEREEIDAELSRIPGN